VLVRPPPDSAPTSGSTGDIRVEGATGFVTISGSVYEAEVGDLDWDSDLDLFFVSLSGFSEGHVRNELVETGSLDFTVQQVVDEMEQHVRRELPNADFDS